MMNTHCTPSLWRCLQHVALFTANLEATIHFYTTFLGMTTTPICASAEGRYCMVRPDLRAMWGIYFHETDLSVAPMRLPALTLPCTARPHVALEIEDETAAIFLRTRLLANWIPVTAIQEVAFQGKFLFPDNNGHLLEVIWTTSKQMTHDS